MEGQNWNLFLEGVWKASLQGFGTVCGAFVAALGSGKGILALTAVFTHFEKCWCSLVEACWATCGCHVSSFWTFLGSRTVPKMDPNLIQNWIQKCA